MKQIFRILAVGRELRASYIAISIFTTLLSLATVVTPLLSGWAIDEMRKGTGADVRYVVLLATGIFLLDLMQTAFSNINGYIGDQVQIRLQKILSSRYYEHLMTLPQNYFDTELSGKIINRLNRSIAQVTNFIHAMSNNFLQFIFSTVFSLAAVTYYRWQVALMLFTLYPIFIWVTVRSSGKWLDYQKTKNEHTDIASGRFAEAVGQIKVVKSYIQEKRELSFFDHHMGVVVKTNRPQSRHWHKQDVKRRLVLNVIFYGVYLYIFSIGARGEISPGQAVALILYAMNIRLPIFTISWLVEQTQKAVADSRDYFEVMNMQPAITDRQNAKRLTVKKPVVEFADVRFAYADGQDVIKGISFTINPGKKAALVGESGEGKTTLTNLLMRLYEPSSGAIRIDGHNIADVTQASLRENIGVVFQEPNLFSGTIRENIAYTNSNASNDDIERAAKAANAHEFIKDFEKGYDTEIGERGLKLSGGQKQRIAIARAILKDAPILIL
ncbi:ABC transporter ATP-binding protein, partial [Candidatus Saccharibacteria bacterium]|nr:ABC transporter ATP-binding protein [Candidatus Saccharibacteria bacterium]